MRIKKLNNMSASKNDFWRGSQSPRKKKKEKNLKRKLLFALIILAAIGTLSAFILVAWISRDLPNPNQLINREVAQSTKIYDRSGEHVLYEIHGEKKRTLVTLSDIPDNVKHATVAIEDKNFYKHGGFSVWAVFRTLVTNIIYNRKAGGSTLTQQLVKNAILSSEKSYIRKIKEIIISQRLEKKFSKDEILQMYLNEIPYGSNTYGVEAASQKFFGKDIKDVNLAEAALLASLPQAPTRYSPYGPNKDILMGRKNYVLDQMADQGYITTAQRDAAKSYQIKFAAPETSITAPHLVMMVKQMLVAKYGESEVETGGLKIYTTIDWDKQKIAEEVIKEKTKDYKKKYNADNAALIAIDPKTGQVLAMVGSEDYFDDSIDGQVNITTSPRQPGSSMKPIVYASLFEKGYTPNTKVYDVVTNFSTDEAKPYIPHNYDDKEHGPVSLRQALAGSLNIPAVKAIYLSGVDNVLNLTDSLGYSTLKDRSRYGLSLVLGGGEVKMIDHVNAYSAFAREGLIHETAVILKVEDSKGKVLEEYKPKEKRVLTTKTAQMINSILTDNNARAYVFGEHSKLVLPDREVAAKTGTTNDYHDAWTIGYTPSLVAGVWVGNTDNSKMKNGSEGVVVAAPIWNEFMKRSLGDTPKETFHPWKDEKTGNKVIDGEIQYEKKMIIDKNTGLPATENTPQGDRQEVTIYDHHSILYYINRLDPLGPPPENPADDPQFNNWEEGVKTWAEANNQTSSPQLINDMELIKPENKPTISFINPSEGMIVNGNSLTVKVSASAPLGIKTIKYQLNDVPLISNGAESESTIDLSNLSSGYQKISATACDAVGNCQTSSVNFNLVKN